MIVVRPLGQYEHPPLRTLPYVKILSIAPAQHVPEYLGIVASAPHGPMVAKRGRTEWRKPMACTVRRAVDVEVALDTKGQTREKVFELVDAILRQNGAIECGIMAFLSVGLGDHSARELGSAPSAELKKHGVTSLKTTHAS